MERDRPHKLTNPAVGVLLLLALLAMLAGIGLAFRTPFPENARVVSLAALPGGLAALDPAAWVTLGGLLLLATPIARLLGMGVGFARGQDRRALLAVVVVLLIMASSVGLKLAGVLPGVKAAPSSDATEPAGG